MWLLNCTFSLMFMFSSTTWDMFPFNTQWNGACTSGPVVVCLGLSSVSRGSSPRRLRKYFVHHVLLGFSPPLCLHVIHTVPLWDCTDLLLQCFLRHQSWMALICNAIWKGDLYEVQNIHEFLVALLDSCMVPLWDKGKLPCDLNFMAALNSWAYLHMKTF